MNSKRHNSALVRKQSEQKASEEIKKENKIR
jgi:hypothetical protein